MLKYKLVYGTLLIKKLPLFEALTVKYSGGTATICSGDIISIDNKTYSTVKYSNLDELKRKIPGLSSTILAKKQIRAYLALPNGKY